MSRKNTCPVLSLSPRAVSCFQARWRRGVCDLGAFGRHLVSGQRHFLRIAPTEFHLPRSAPNGSPQRGHGQTQRSAAAARAEIEAQKRKDECSDSRGESGGSCLRRGQARRHLTQDLLIVSGYRPLHMNTSASYAGFLRQPLELTLKKRFQLLRCQDGNRKSRGLAVIGFDLHAVWGFGLLRFRSHATPLFLSDENGRQSY
jgi:hypothetical protein